MLFCLKVPRVRLLVLLIRVVRKTSRRMLYMERVAVYSEDSIETHKCTVWTKFILLSVKPSGMYANGQAF